jgi:Uma2 family endonuclease
VPPRQQSHARPQQLLFRIFLPLTEGRGFLNMEFPFRCAGEEAWQADLGFVREERSDIPDPYLPGAPNLVIEVLSPSNTVDEINDKMDVCMANGCTSFWVVDPRRKTVAVTEGDTTREYRGSATIPLPAPLEDPRPPLMTTEPTSNEQPR